MHILVTAKCPFNAYNSVSLIYFSALLVQGPQYPNGNLTFSYFAMPSFCSVRVVHNLKLHIVQIRHIKSITDFDIRTRLNVINYDFAANNSLYAIFSS